MRNPIEHAREWIGLVFAIGIVLHIINHWESFKNYFTQRLAVSIMGSTMITSAPYFEGKVQGSLSIPSFYDNFNTEQGIVSNNEINVQLAIIIKIIYKNEESLFKTAI